MFKNIFSSKLLSLLSSSVTPEINSWTEEKLFTLYKKSPDYYIEDGSYNFESCKQQLLAILDFVIKETEGRYLLFSEYKMRVNKLLETNGDVEKAATLLQAKKALEESLWFICNHSIEPSLLMRYTVDKCAVGAATNLGMALQHFSTTGFEAAVQVCKETLVLGLVQDYVNDFLRYPEIAETHVVTAYFNYLASDYGYKEKIDE